MNLSENPPSFPRRARKSTKRRLLEAAPLIVGVILLLWFVGARYVALVARNESLEHRLKELNAEAEKAEDEISALQQKLNSYVKSGAPIDSTYYFHYVKDPEVQEELLKKLVNDLDSPALQTRVHAISNLRSFEMVGDLDSETRAKLVPKIVRVMEAPWLDRWVPQFLAEFRSDAKSAIPALERVMDIDGEFTMNNFSNVCDAIRKIDPSYDLAPPLVRAIRERPDDANWAIPYLQQHVPQQAARQAIQAALQDNPTPEQRQRLKKLSRQVGSGTID